MLPIGVAALEAGPRQAQDVAHGHADAASVERVRGAGAQQHAVDIHARGVAEDAADILVVAHTFHDDERLCTLDDLVNRPGVQAVRGREQAAVHVKAGDLGEHVAGDLVDGHVVGHLVLRQVGVDLRLEAHNAAGGVRGGEQALDDDGALANDKTLAVGVGLFQVPNVIQARVVDVFNYVAHVPDTTVSGMQRTNR